jgi:hypothetical protein
MSLTDSDEVHGLRRGDFRDWPGSERLCHILLTVLKMGVSSLLRAK